MILVFRYIWGMCVVGWLIRCFCLQKLCTVSKWLKHHLLTRNAKLEKMFFNRQNGCYKRVKSAVGTTCLDSSPLLRTLKYGHLPAILSYTGKEPGRNPKHRSFWESSLFLHELRFLKNIHYPFHWDIQHLEE